MPLPTTLHTVESLLSRVEDDLARVGVELDPIRVAQGDVERGLDETNKMIRSAVELRRALQRLIVERRKLVGA